MKDKGIEILIGGIILATLGFLSVRIFDISSTVGRIDGTVLETSKRMDRIANVLPEMRIRIAKEEMRKQIELLLVATLPKKHSNGWVSNIRLFDTNKNICKVYVLDLKSQGDTKYEMAKYILKGASSDIRHYASLAEVSDWSNQLNQPVLIPTSIDKEASFVFHSSNYADYEKALEHYEKALLLLSASHTKNEKCNFESKDIDKILSEIQKTIEK